MAQHFEKYHGTGNDFILLRGEGPRQIWESARVARACSRHTGIGADGLMILWAVDGADFHLDYYNADGGLGSLCGNGSRCAVDFAFRHGLFVGEICHFFASDGLHQAERHSADQIKVHFSNASHLHAQHQGFYVHTGSPHHLCFVENVDAIDLAVDGPSLRYGPYAAAGGANINWLSPTGTEGAWQIRTYERGVEAETLSCGTGAVAGALALHQYHGLPSPITIEARGGRLRVDFNKEGEWFSNIRLTGPAVFIFEGVWLW
ncbi:MAG: diaminopimelate epimerase [Schleiferiaceae bacterium]|nr:diaminopimelate epimerase [Schleiferiaceae bacterium]